MFHFAVLLEVAWDFFVETFCLVRVFWGCSLLCDCWILEWQSAGCKCSGHFRGKGPTQCIGKGPTQCIGEEIKQNFKTIRKPIQKSPNHQKTWTCSKKTCHQSILKHCR